MQWRQTDEHFEECSQDQLAVGGVLLVDILSLPTPASKAKLWTLHQVTSHSEAIHRYITPSLVCSQAGLTALPGTLQLGEPTLSVQHQGIQLLRPAQHMGYAEACVSCL